jgi:hypothetical protein
MTKLSNVKKQGTAPQKEVAPSYVVDAIETAKELRKHVEEAIETIVEIAGCDNPNTRKRILMALCDNAVYQLPWRKEDLDKAQDTRSRIGIDIEQGDHGRTYAFEGAEKREHRFAVEYHNFKMFHDVALAAHKSETGLDFQPQRKASGSDHKTPDFSRFKKK